MVIIIYIFIGILFPIFAMDQHQEPHEHCIGRISYSKIVECVLDHSPEFKHSLLELKAMQGKKTVAGYLFPSNPTLQAYNAFRKGPPSDNPLIPGNNHAVNGEIAIYQEIYLGNKRSGKMELADAEFNTQITKIEVIKREITALALSSSLKYKFYQDELTLTKELYQLANGMYEISNARAVNGLGAPIDADIAKAESIRLFRIMQLAERKVASAKADLTVMMGIPYPSELSLLSIPETKELPTGNPEAVILDAFNRRLDAIVAEQEYLISAKRLEVQKRERIPNLTLSGFLQKDGFNENVVGARISIPLPVWRTNKGETEESQARKDQSESTMEVRKHMIRFEVIRAVTNYKSLKEELTRYPDSLLKRVDENMELIQKALQRGQLNVRDALLSQQSLVSLKLSHIQTKTELELAKIELLRSAGLSFFE